MKRDMNVETRPRKGWSPGTLTAAESRSGVKGRARMVTARGGGFRVLPLGRIESMPSLGGK